MKNAKSLLDSLMGPSRNLTSKERTGEDFMKDDVCKHFLVAFCPVQALSKHVESVEACKLLHSVALKEELEKHPEAEKYKREYEAQHLRKIEDLVTEADIKASKEKRKCRPPEKLVKVPEHLKNKVQGFEETRKERMAEAERLGREGDIEGSQVAMGKAHQAQKDIDSIKEAHTQHFPGEEVCLICGQRYLIGNSIKAGGYDRLKEGEVWEDDHMASKGHEAYQKLRDSFRDLKKWQHKQNREAAENKEKSLSRGGRRSSDREKNRTQDKDRGNNDRRRSERRRSPSRSRGGGNNTRRPSASARRRRSPSNRRQSSRRRSPSNRRRRSPSNRRRRSPSNRRRRSRSRSDRRRRSSRSNRRRSTSRGGRGGRRSPSRSRNRR